MARISASRNFKRTALAVGLCVLAFVFAMEAKMAWYSTAGGSGTEIAAAKARAADLPEVVAHGIPAPDPVHPQVFFVFLAALTAASLWKPDVLSGRRFVHSDLAISSVAYFSSNLFFRPPPVR
jgi:hypothetical protein